MKKWIKVNFSKKIRDDHTIQKQISCELSDFDFSKLSVDMDFFDECEIKISLI